MSEERRKNPRYKIQVWAEEKCSDASYFHLLTNLSIGGFFIDKKLPFTGRAELDLELALPGDEEKIKVKGVVVNNYKHPDSSFSGAGIKFKNLSKEAKDRIEKYLASLNSE